MARRWPGSLLFITGLCGAGCRGGARLPGAATPPLDVERDAFGDRDGVPPRAEPSCSEPWGHGPGRGQGGSGFWRMKSSWVGLPPLGTQSAPPGQTSTPEALISLRVDAVPLPLTFPARPGREACTPPLPCSEHRCLWPRDAGQGPPCLEPRGPPGPAAQPLG